MRKRKIYLLSLLMLSLIIDFCIAQNERTLFENYSQISGLSQSTITCIYQDKRGFMWFGTQSGLNCFNGYKMLIYKSDPVDLNSLSEDFITAVYEDEKNNLWVGTSGNGISVLLPNKLSWKRYKFNSDVNTSLSDDRITCIYEDVDKNLWVGTQNGLNKYVEEYQGFKRVNINEIIPSTNNHIISISEDKNNNLWILTSKAIVKYDYKNDKVVPFHYSSYNPSERWLQKMYLDKSNCFWFFSGNQNLIKFDCKKGLYQEYVSKGNIASNLSRYVFSSFMETGDGKIIYSTYGDGLMCVDPETTNSTNMFFTKEINEPINLKNISYLFLDKQSIYWVGTYDKGAYKYDPGRSKFIHHEKNLKDLNSLSDNLVWQILEDKEGYLWFKTNNALDRYDRHKNQYTHYNINASGVFEDERRNIYIPDGSIILKFDFSSKRFVKVSETAKFLNLKYSLPVTRLLFDKKNNIWAISSSGLIKYNKSDNTSILFTHNSSDDKSISDNVLTNIFESSAGDIFISTSKGGLNRYNPKDNSFDRFLYNPNDIMTAPNKRAYPIMEDSKGNIWVGTMGGGIHMLDFKNNKNYNYTYRDGLSDNCVAGILEDKSGKIWISTFNGFCQLDPETKFFIKYDISDGLQSLDFNVLASCKTIDGEFFFGGVNGYNSFYPEKIKYNDFVPVIAITGFEKAFKKKNMKARYNAIPEAELDYNDNSFTIEFVALNFRNTHKNQYQYKLEGFDEDWIYCGTRRYASYTNIDPGEYIFRVKGSNNDMVWNNEGTMVKVIILPPFWKTWYAYSFYVLLSIGLLYFSYLLIKIRHRKKEEIKIEKERERIKLLEAELRLRNAELEAAAARAQVLAAENQAKIIQAENSRKTFELEEARKLQLSMLPNVIPKIPHLDLSVYMKTATEVGGDYYDFLNYENEKFVMSIGDATGHGLKAGMMVSIIKSLFYSEDFNSQIIKFFEKCSGIIKRMHLGNLYMGLSIVKIEKYSMTFASAGMPPTYIYHEADSSLEEFKFKTMPLGAFVDFSYREIKTELKKGDTILFMSDGLPEQFNPDAEVLGYERIKEVFTGCARKNPDEIINALLQMSADWSEGNQQNDDITIIVIKVN